MHHRGVSAGFYFSSSLDQLKWNRFNEWDFRLTRSYSHLSTVLGNKFDHGAEAIVPVLFNLIPNCAKVMATSGVSAIRIIIRVGFWKKLNSFSLASTLNTRNHCLDKIEHSNFSVTHEWLPDFMNSSVRHIGMACAF